MDGPNDADATVRLACGDRPSVRDEIAAERVVSVLFGTDVETWRSGWWRTAAGPPSREAVVDASDVARSGAASSTQVMANEGLAYTVLGRGAVNERVLDAVASHFDGVPSGTVDLVIDDLAPVAARNGSDSAVAFTDRLLKRFEGRANRIALGYSSGSPVELVSRVGDSVDSLVGTDPEADAVERLAREDPTTFGYVRRHWAEAKRGVEACDRNYPQSKQVHAALADPETTPRTLGATLSGLVTLGALDTWSETVGPTRYDLTAYRPDRAWAIGVAVEASGSDD
ncbi:hypothetical protein [Halorubrum tebenquichense]|uniref:Uncharacterized protein n=1 Tax=Halorubrum tebenquichense DSM 14210 TaxID=1227485 RepID=M0DJG7_9EURY|nr:hypothetical protein [Halorubrum tebenquichense]ELZ35595.1 hypothetical protein C472_12341 [Halorubrum tebenquichense DSM 14210]